MKATPYHPRRRTRTGIYKFSKASSMVTLLSQPSSELTFEKFEDTSNTRRGQSTKRGPNPIRSGRQRRRRNARILRYTLAPRPAATVNSLSISPVPQVALPTRPLCPPPPPPPPPPPARLEGGLSRLAVVILTW